MDLWGLAGVQWQITLWGRMIHVVLGPPFLWRSQLWKIGGVQGGLFYRELQYAYKIHLRRWKYDNFETGFSWQNEGKILSLWTSQPSDKEVLYIKVNSSEQWSLVRLLREGEVVYLESNDFFLYSKDKWMSTVISTVVLHILRPKCWRPWARIMANF